MRTKINAKYVIFAGVAAMMGYVLFHNERFLFESEHPVWQHYEPFKWWLLPHGIAGAFVLLLAPLQFSERLRKRYVKLHRVCGRLYVIGAVVLAPLGAYIQYVEERQGFPRSFTVLGIVDAVLLLTTTLIAFVFAYQRKIAQHKQWMNRSYALALVFITARFTLGVTGWESLGVEIVQAVIWSCLALSLLAADVINNWAELRAKAARPVLKEVAKEKGVTLALQINEALAEVKPVPAAQAPIYE